MEGPPHTHPWTYSDTTGNPWRARAGPKARVLAMPIWLYCDDTSGNLSKKWNAHNSFLFSLAGLPRSEAAKEYNVHFLSTSNIAPPLEMAEGILQQVRYVHISCNFLYNQLTRRYLTFPPLGLLSRMVSGFGMWRLASLPLYSLWFLRSLETILCRARWHLI